MERLSLVAGFAVSYYYIPGERPDAVADAKTLPEKNTHRLRKACKRTGAGHRKRLLSLYTLIRPEVGSPEGSRRWPDTCESAHVWVCVEAFHPFGAE